MSRRTPGLFVFLLTTISAVGLAVLAPPAWGQSGTGARPLDTAPAGLAVPRPAPSFASVGDRRVPSTGQSVSLPAPTPPVPHPSADEDVQFDRALAGSAMGAAVGGLLGAALIAAAEPENREPYGDDENNDPESLGLLLIAGGAPVGAVLNTRIPRDHAGTYIMAVLGEVVLGGAGFALGTTLRGDSDRDRLIGGLAVGGAGVILGAAGGAVLAAPDGSGAALNYEDGSWRAQPPAVQVGVHRQPQLGLHGTVSLVSVEL